MGTRFFLEGLWQQYINTRVTFKLLAKDDFGNPKDTPAKITAVLRGPKEWEVEVWILSGYTHSVQATVAREETGVYVLEFNPDFEGDYQMFVMVNGHLLYQWLVQLRPQTAHCKHNGNSVTECFKLEPPYPFSLMVLVWETARSVSLPTLMFMPGVRLSVIFFLILIRCLEATRRCSSSRVGGIDRLNPKRKKSSHNKGKHRRI